MVVDPISGRCGNGSRADVSSRCALSRLRFQSAAGGRKDGFSNGKRAYSCGDCRRRYVPAGAYRRPGSAVKERGIELCLEGNTLSGIGRVLGYGVSAVQGWVKKRDGKR